MSTLYVKEDSVSGDLYLEFTDELMAEVGWNIGDEITWTEREDGSWILRKKDDVLVEEEKGCN